MSFQAWFGSGIRAFEDFTDENIYFAGNGGATFEANVGASSALAIFVEGGVEFGDPTANQQANLAIAGTGDVFFDTSDGTGEDNVAVHDGTSWVYCDAFVHDGTSWVAVEIYTHDGLNWK